MRRLIETLAATAPPVVVFEDVHWAEVTFLDLIEDLARETAGPLLVVCTARDDVLEARPAWGQGSTEILLRLEALGEAELRLVLANLLGTEEVPQALVERLVRVTEGNPLFVEQTVSMLMDRGLLRQADDRSWVLAVDAADASMPATIHALLSARIDQLGADDRGVLQAGSVIGLEFYRGAVAAMSAPEPPAPPVLDASLDTSIGTLVRRQLIRPIPSTFADESTFRFGHILIKDAAYGALLLRQRVDLHERFAAWLERTAGSRLNELEEIVGYHLEQGARCLAELGSLDGRRRTLAVAASERLAHSGARAFSRGDMPAAANLIERAANLLDADEPDRATLLLELAEARSDLGESERAEAALGEALGTAGTLGDTLLETNAQLVRSYIHYTIDPEGRSDEVLRETQAAIPILEAAGDHAGLVRAWRLLAWVHGTACRYGAAEQAVGMAVEHARKAGDRRAVTRNQMSFAIAALYGPMPVPEAIALCDRIVADVSGDRRAEARRPRRPRPPERPGRRVRPGPGAVRPCSRDPRGPRRSPDGGHRLARLGPGRAAGGPARPGRTRAATRLRRPDGDRRAIRALDRGRAPGARRPGPGQGRRGHGADRRQRGGRRRGRRRVAEPLAACACPHPRRAGGVRRGRDPGRERPGDDGIDRCAAPPGGLPTRPGPRPGRRGTIGRRRRAGPPGPRAVRR